KRSTASRVRNIRGGSSARRPMTTSTTFASSSPNAKNFAARNQVDRTGFCLEAAFLAGPAAPCNKIAPRAEPGAAGAARLPQVDDRQEFAERRPLRMHQDDVLLVQPRGMSARLVKIEVVAAAGLQAIGAILH